MARPKKTVDTTAETTAAKKTTTAAKKTTTKAAAVTAEAAPKKTRVRKTVSVTLQYGGTEWSTEVLTERAIVAWAAAMSQPKTAAKDIKLYLKPEDNMVYYVINGDDGKFPL